MTNLALTSSAKSSILENRNLKGSYPSLRFLSVSLSYILRGQSGYR